MIYILMVLCPMGDNAFISIDYNFANFT